MKYVLSAWGLYDWLGRDWGRVVEYARRRHFDGLEIFVYDECQGEEAQAQRARLLAEMPSGGVIGIHTSYYPGAWLGAWKDDLPSPDDAALRERMVRFYRAELALAEELGAQYAVVHGGYSSVVHRLNHLFPHSDTEVLEALARLTAAIFDGFECKVAVLFENLHFAPGLNLAEPLQMKYFLDRVARPNVGLLVDTGHLMNTNPALRGERQAIQFVEGTIEALGLLRSRIRAVHLHRSLSWRYMSSRKRQDQIAALEHASERDQMVAAWRISQQEDQHQPFRSTLARPMVEHLSPDYVSYEFTPPTFEQFDAYVRTQNAALGRTGPDERDEQLCLF